MSNAPERAPRLLFVSEWFDPEPCYKNLRFVRALADKGYDVEVLTGFPNYPGGEVFEPYRIKPYQKETMDGITVHRVPVYPSHDRSTLKRMVTYSSFFVSVLLFLLFRMRRYDFLYVYHPPIMPGLAAAIAGLFHRRRFVLEIQDLWPDSVASSGMAGGPVVKTLNALCNFTYARAKHIICQSDGMIETLATRGVPREKMSRLYNWSNYVPADEDETGSRVPETFEQAFAGHFNIVYGGNLGQAQHLETVIEAAAIAQAEVPEIRVHLVGHGIDRDRLARHAAVVAPDAILMHEGVAREVMDRIFERADALVMHLKDDPLYDITVPSKSQHYMSVGKAIVAGIPGEAGRLLAEGGAHVSRPGDAKAMASSMVEIARMPLKERKAIAEKARAFYASKLSFAHAIDFTAARIDSELPEAVRRIA